ncbi:hypothetical protein OQA88_2673 [Cercophora sp. LCS_1]
MAEICSIMVPLLLTTPYVANSLKAFLNMFYLTADVPDEVRPFPEVPYNVFVRLHTSAFRPKRGSGGHQVLPLADAVNRRLFSRDSLLGPHVEAGASISTSGDHSRTRRFAVPDWVPFFGGGPEN